MTADRLLHALLNAGLRVVQEPGWRTRGNRWNVNGRPEGVMQHHTSLPNPYPIKKLYGPPLYRIKANMATHEDGTLFLISYGACNYSSGYGDPTVLERNVRRSIPPTHNATVRGTKSGNRHFWNYENSHPGDGSPLPPAQFETITVSTAIVLDHFGLNANQVISHAEWTSRKTDPYWDGSNRRAINEIREASMFTPHEIEELKKLVASLDSVQSNGGFAEYAVELVRRERETPLHSHEENT